MRLFNYLDNAKKYKMFVDMDGVLVNWLNGAKNLGLSSEIIDNRIDNPSHQKEIWSAIDKLGAVYWSNLKWMNDGRKLWDVLKLFNTTILSAHGKTKNGDNWNIRHEVIKGKRDWIERNIGVDFAINAIITERDKKKKYAKSNCILIDDDIRNIKEWKSSGGIVILHKNTTNTLKELMKILEN